MKILNFNYVEQVDEDTCHLLNDQDDSYIVISKQDVLNQFQPEQRVVEVVRSGWDDYREKTAWIDPEEDWEEDPASMICEAWDQIERRYYDENEELIKIEEPC